MTPPGQKDAVVQIEAEKKRKMALLQRKRETVWKVRFFAAAVRRRARPHRMRMRSPQDEFPHARTLAVIAIARRGREGLRSTQG